jgi:hypothetical protein
MKIGDHLHHAAAQLHNNSGFRCGIFATMLESFQLSASHSTSEVWSILWNYSIFKYMEGVLTISNSRTAKTSYAVR